MGVEIQRSIPVLIDQDADLMALVDEFNRFQNMISPICFNDGKPLRAIELHRAVYHQIPSTLGSQLKCSAIRLTAAAYNSAKSNGKPATRTFLFTRKSALFLIEKRGRDAAFRKGMLSITTRAGRKKLGYRIPAHFQHDFDTAVKHNAIRVQGNGKASLCLTLEVPDPKSVVPVGIDVGIRNLLVASTADETLVISGSTLNQRNRRTRKTRSRIQAKHAEKKAQHKDTRSVRRVLKRLSRKTKNRNDTVAKQTAAQLCKWVPADAVLVFEDLRIKPKSKKEHIRRGTRRKLNGWFYRQLIQATKNRAERDGLAVSFVNPAFSSQNCSRCSALGERRLSSFFCPACGFTADADVNASHNLRLSFAVLRDGGRLSTRPEALSSDEGKPPALAGGS